MEGIGSSWGKILSLPSVHFWKVLIFLESKQEVIKVVLFGDITYLFSYNRVRTETGNQNSRTFPGLFKHYLHFFQESFFIDSNSPNTA